MTKYKSIVALIPARGGSKGLPRKNLAEVLGVPLITYTIRAAKGVFSPANIIVSSDSDEILSVAEKEGIVPFKRPEEFASDHSSTFEVIDHFLSKYPNVEVYDTLVLLQPTSPLRGEEHIRGALDCKQINEASSCVSVERADSSCLKWVVQQGNKISPLSDKQYPFYRRQDLPDVYKPNGAIYVVDLDAYRKEKTLITDKCVPFLMSGEANIDIDSKEDLDRFVEVLETI